MRPLLLGSLLCLSVACADPGDKSAPTAAQEGALATVEATASATPEPAPVDRSTIPTQPEKRPLHVAAYLKHHGQFAFGGQSSNGFRLFAFADRMIVAKAGEVYTFDGERLKLDPKAVTTEKVEGNTPLLGAYEIDRLEGRWPDLLWARAEFHSFMGPRQFSDRTVEYRRADGKWTVEKELPRRVAAWKGGSFLGLTAGKLAVVAGSAPHELAQTRAPEGAPGCTQGGPLLTLEDVATLEAGDVLALGRRCDDQKRAVEWWKAGSTTSTIADLPEHPLDNELQSHGHRVLARGESAFVTLSARSAPFYLWRLDRGVFRRVVTHDVGAVTSSFLAADGTFFATVVGPRGSHKDPNVLVSVTSDHRYVRFMTEKVLPLGSVWAHDKDTAYVAIERSYGDEAVLLSTQPKKILGDPPADLFQKEAEVSAAPSETFKAFTDRCQAPFVFLYDVAASTPKGFDFPKTKKALKAFAERTTESLLDFSYQGKRRLGIKVPSGEIGQKLVAHMKKEMPEDDPRLVCFEAPLDAVAIKL